MKYISKQCQCRTYLHLVLRKLKEIINKTSNFHRSTSEFLQYAIPFLYPNKFSPFLIPIYNCKCGTIFSFYAEFSKHMEWRIPGLISLVGWCLHYQVQSSVFCQRGCGCPSISWDGGLLVFLPFWEISMPGNYPESYSFIKCIF